MPGRRQMRHASPAKWIIDHLPLAIQSKAKKPGGNKLLTSFKSNGGHGTSDLTPLSPMRFDTNNSLPLSPMGYNGTTPPMDWEGCHPRIARKMESAVWFPQQNLLSANSNPALQFELAAPMCILSYLTPHQPPLCVNLELWLFALLSCIASAPKHAPQTLKWVPLKCYFFVGIRWTEFEPSTTKMQSSLM
jgi:hypothetical protein